MIITYLIQSMQFYPNCGSLVTCLLLFILKLFISKTFFSGNFNKHIFLEYFAYNLLLCVLLVGYYS